MEEPPPHVKFVFATTESHKVLPTIVSRCQRFEFRSIATPLIVDKLKEICQAEKIEAEQEALEVVGRMAMGGMGPTQAQPTTASPPEPGRIPYLFPFGREILILCSRAGRTDPAGRELPDS